MACAPSEDSEQPGHPPSLIRVFPVCMELPIESTAKTLIRLGTQSFCWFCREVALMSSSCAYLYWCIIPVCFRASVPSPVSMITVNIGGPVAEWLRTKIFSALNRSPSHRCGFEPSLDHVRRAMFCLRVVRWFFSKIFGFCLTLQLAQLKMSEIIFIGPISKKTAINISHDSWIVPYGGSCLMFISETDEDQTLW